MQDPRIRITSAAILSLAAFLSLHGAAAVFLWWLVFTPCLQIAKRIRLVFSLILMIAFFSVVLELSGGSGLSYFFRNSNHHFNPPFGSCIYFDFFQDEFTFFNR